MTHGLVAVNRRERSVNSSVGIGYLCSWITGKGSPPGTHPDQAIAVARAAVTADERRKQPANRVLYRLPSSNLNEAEKQRRVDMEPRRFDREKDLVTDATSLISEVSEVQALSELFPRTM
ncbi:hypothetical protein, partial [Rhodopirellula baltica]|uniref:hypothetical protein n=1 Tax=Rhodopirellula baltica TaxID=265606 RepID=UPI00114726E2